MQPRHILHIALGVFALFAGYAVGGTIYTTYFAKLTAK